MTFRANVACHSSVRQSMSNRLARNVIAETLRENVSRNLSKPYLIHPFSVFVFFSYLYFVGRVLTDIAFDAVLQMK
jgi:hypothetical protein